MCARELTSERRPAPGELRRHSGLGLRRTRASAEQRRKVAGRACLVCGRAPVDPAHLVPQRFGGCADAACVVALCRAHHRLYDSARLALAPYLGQELWPEVEHALTHVGAADLAAALAGAGWPPPWTNNDNLMEDER